MSKGQSPVDLSGTQQAKNRPATGERERMAALPQRDLELVTDLRKAALAERHTVHRWSLVVIALLLLCGIWWALWARLDEVTVGSGEVVPYGHEQSIQTVDGGVLEELFVREGDSVEKDQVLARMDPTRSSAFLREGQTKAIALRAAATRLKAEASGREPEFDQQLRQAHPELVQLETRAFQSRRRALLEAVGSRQRALELAQQELSITAPLAAKGIVSDVEVLRLRRQVAELEGQIVDQRNKFYADASAELTKTESELGALDEMVNGRADQVKQTILRAPVRGLVKSIRAGARGAVLRPGEEIMQVLPTDERLIVEAKIRPADVAFLRPGLPAKVKISAYDYTIYGALSGVIEQISPDTVPDENRRGETFYRVRVRTEQASLRAADGRALPIIAGMTATVEILTGQKTVMDYLLKPVLKARDALREK